MGHNHSHEHSDTKNLKVAFFLNLAFTLFEFFGGIYTNSVAILSDAVHDLGDSLSLGTSWYLQIKSKQKADKKFSFGYRRFSLFGALINSIVLIIGGVFVTTEAIERLVHPENSNAEGMILFALIGIAVNGYAAWKLSHGKSMNEKVISWHLVEDVLGWVAVLIVSIVLFFKNIPYLDPGLSLLITAYILWNVLKRLKETLYLFLQGKPHDVNMDLIEKQIREIPNVKSLHQMHIWSMDGEHHVFTTHVKLEKIDSFAQLLAIKKQLNTIMKKYPFEHHTIETELVDEDCGLNGLN